MSNDEKLKSTNYFVEADEFAYDELWRKHYHNNNRADKLEWVQDRAGFSRTIGSLDLLNQKPVVVKFSFFIINNKYVCFYYPSSRFVDWDMVDKFIAEFGKNKCNAENFRNCMSFCEVVEFENNIDVTKEWFVKTFEQITEDVSNSEKLEDVSITHTDNNTVIQFLVNCGRYGQYDGTIVIDRKRNAIIMNMPEIMEGGDVDSRVKKAIQKLITKD